MGGELVGPCCILCCCESAPFAVGAVETADGAREVEGSHRARQNHRMASESTAGHGDAPPCPAGELSVYLLHELDSSSFLLFS